MNDLANYERTRKPTTRSFPQISQLPKHIVADAWTWDKLVTPSGIGKDFWVGTDQNGHRWVVKMSDSFYAYRERIFGDLAQRLGLSCQSSVLLTLPEGCLPLNVAKEKERYQSALWLLNEHEADYCGLDCPLKSLDANLNDPEIDRVELLKKCKVLHATDWVRGDLLACLCGANEPSDGVFTQDHEFVLINNEQMFSFHPRNNLSILDCGWLKGAGDQISKQGMQIAMDLLTKFSKISDVEIEDICTIPLDYKTEELWEIKPIVYGARDAARDSLDLLR